MTKVERWESLDEIKAKQRRFELIKIRIHRNLFKIHPVIVKISYIWFSQYRLVPIIVPMAMAITYCT